MVRLHARRTAIQDGDFQCSYEQLGALAAAAAQGFLALGIARGDRVAIWAPNFPEWVVAALGAQSIGAVLVPLNTRLKGREAAYILNHSQARLLLTVDRFLDNDYLGLLRGQSLPALERTILLRGNDRAGEAMAWEAFVESGKAVSASRLERAMAEVRPDDLLDLMFTSGTTGQPKAVASNHEQNLRVFQTWSGQVGLNAADRYLIINPFFHSFGYKAGWLAALMHGACILPMAVFDARQALAQVARHRVTVLPGPPTIYHALLALLGEAADTVFDLSSLRLAVTGASVVPVELIQRMHEELGFDTVLTAYGLTETCGVVSMCTPGDDPRTIATTCGRAIEGVELRCVDPRGETLPPGQPGEIVVRGYNVMQGYFRDPEQTAQAIDPDGWLHTGDVGVLDERGYLRITDRLKDMFIVGGFNCYPAELENLISSMPGVAQVAVIGVPEPRLGEVAAAFVVPRPGARLEEAGVIAWCRDNMANYKVPRRVVLVEALPLNASGKVLKNELRRQWAAEDMVVESR